MVQLLTGSPVFDVQALVLGDGETTAHSIGDGIALVEQADAFASQPQCTALSDTDLEAIQDSTALTLLLYGGALRVFNMGSGVYVIDEIDRVTGHGSRVVLTATDIAAMLAWLGTY